MIQALRSADRAAVDRLYAEGFVELGARAQGSVPNCYCLALTAKGTARHERNELAPPHPYTRDDQVLDRIVNVDTDVLVRVVGRQKP